MAVLHGAVANDDVFDRDVDAPAIIVAAGLQRDAVIAGIERTTFDEDVAARLGIAAVVVRTVTADAHVANRDAAAQDRVDLPHRRIDDGRTVNEDVAAAVGLD